MKTAWQTKKLTELVADIPYPIGDGDHGQIKPSFYKSDGIPYIRVGDMGWGEFKPNNVVYISKEVHQANLKSELRPGDVLIAKTGATIGKCCIVPDFIEKANTTSSVGKITLNKNKLIPKWLLYWFLSPEFYKYIWSISKRAAQPGFNIKDMKMFEIPLPSLSEQKILVKKLDEVFEKVAKAKDAAEKNLQNAKELFESYLQSVFAMPGKDWVETNLGDAYDVRDGTHDSPRYHKEGFALVTSKNLKRDLLNFDKIKYISEKDYRKINDRSKVDKGDILFAMIGTIGNPVVVVVEPDFAIKNVALFKIPKEQSAYFLKYFLDSKYIIDKMMSEAKGTTQKFVGLGYLRSFKIKLPPLAEQKAIVKKLDALSVETRKLEKIYEQKLADLEELKKSILSKAFHAEL